MTAALACQSLFRRLSNGRSGAIAGGCDPENGARPLARAIERLVTRPLSEKLLAGAFQPGDKVTVAVARGEVIFTSEAAEPDSDLTR